MDGGRHLRVAEVEPRLLVVVVGLGVAGVDGGELGCGGRSSGAVGISVAGGLGRRWCVLRAPGDVWSTMVCSVGRYGDRGHDGDIAGGVELSVEVELGPRGRERPGKRGKRSGGSPRLQWASKRARGRAGDDEFDGDGGRSPKRGTATWRRCRASGELWSGGEEEGVVAELLS